MADPGLVLYGIHERGYLAKKIAGESLFLVFWKMEEAKSLLTAA